MSVQSLLEFDFISEYPVFFVKGNFMHLLKVHVTPDMQLSS